jgi:hypothetical protein
MSADALGLNLDALGARIEWEPGALRALADGSTEPAWRLADEPDWEALESLRVVSAAFEDGRLLAVAAARPVGADGHDAAEPRGILVDAGGEAVELAEALLSTEYDADGTPTRIGLEIYPRPGAIPLRVAADREGPARVDDGAETTAMSFRMDGARGSGVFERVSRG